MKQGQSSFSRPEGRKMEPAPHGIKPGYAGQIGIAQGSHATDIGDTGYRGESMDAGRGFKAPGSTDCSSNCGSQGKY